MERAVDRRIGTVSAVMPVLHRSVCGGARTEPRGEALNSLVHPPPIAAKMSFLGRVAGLSLRDEVWSSDIREELWAEPLLLHTERSQLSWVVVRWFDGFQIGVVWVMSAMSSVVSFLTLSSTLSCLMTNLKFYI